MPRARATHRLYGAQAFGVVCRAGERGEVAWTLDDAAVTCKRCVYQLWRAGQIADTDPRITDRMRAHARGEIVPHHGRTRR